MNLGPINKSLTHAAIAAIILLLFIGIAFQEVPGNSFHFDDYTNIVNHEPMRLQTFSADGVWQAGTGALLPRRLLPNMSFAADWLRGNGSPRPFLWTNLILHSANAMLVSIFLALLLQAKNPRQKISPLWLAPVLFSVIIWAIHPIQVQAVTYIVQRMASMAAFFSLVTLISYIVGRRSQNHSRAWLTLSAISLILALACKETAAILPFLIFMVELGIIRQGKPLNLSRWEYALLALLVLLVIAVSVDLISGSGPISQWAAPRFKYFQFTLFERLLTQPQVVFFHLSQILWPIPGRFSIEHDFALSTGLLNPPVTLLAILAMLCWIGGALWLLLRHPKTRIWGFCLLWPPATLAIESSFLPLEMVFEHRMYFPMVGLAGLLALGLQSAAHHSAKTFIICAVPTCALLLLSLSTTLQRVPDWKSTLTLYEKAIPHAPNNPRLWANLGSEYFKLNQFAKSEQATDTALRIDANDIQALEIKGALLLQAGRISEAERFFQQALTQGEPSHALINQLGFLAVRQGNFPRARDLFVQAAEQMPWNPAYIWNAALALERTGNCAKAHQQWEYYLSLDVSAEERQQVRSRLQQEYYSLGGRCAGAH